MIFTDSSAFLKQMNSADFRCLQLPKEICYQILENINVPGVLLVSKWALAHIGGCTLNGLKHTIISVFFPPECQRFFFFYITKIRTTEHI